jgi:hypothetical protein
MAHTDDSQEWLRLTRLYQELDEVDLLQLRDDFDNLASIAQEVLRPILQTRNLWQGPEVAKVTTPTPQRADYSLLRTTSDVNGSAIDRDRDSLLKDEGIAVRACESMEDASLLSDYLTEKQIECLVITTKRGYPVRFPEILVFSRDVEKATELLDNADIEALRRTAEAQSAESIEGSSQCPVCGSTEILLPCRPDCLNSWLCGDCGRSWQDNLPADLKTEG